MKRTLGTLMLLAVVATACGGSGPTTVEVRAVDYGFEDLPETVVAGSTLTLVNESSVELHELVAIRLPDDEKRSADELVQLPPEELAQFFPLVDSVIIAPPGGGDDFAVEGTGILNEPPRTL